jgi:hypothetical protein
VGGPQQAAAKLHTVGGFMMQPPREILVERYQDERVAEGSGKIACCLARRVGTGEGLTLPTRQTG